MQSYRHTQTGRYIHIDGQDGRFHNQNREAITAKQALDFAMPEGQKHSHSHEVKIEKEHSRVRLWYRNVTESIDTRKPRTYFSSSAAKGSPAKHRS